MKTQEPEDGVVMNSSEEKCVSPDAKQPALPWLYRTSSIVILFLILPPLVIPSLIGHPRISKAWKIIIGLGVLILSYILWLATLKSLETLKPFLELFEHYQAGNL